MLEAWGLVKQVDVRQCRHASEVLQGWQLNGTCHCAGPCWIP